MLPNAWDAVSARLIESLGAKAIATTSAGLAWARGYPDGNALPKEQLIAAIRDIARVIKVPLTVDIEAGYAEDPAAVAVLVGEILAAGVMGINIEDGADSPDLLCKKIAAVREQAVRMGADLYINARTDVYLRGMASGEAAVAETLRRAKLYGSAGCDGVFVPGLSNSEAIGTIAAAIAPMPLNIMAVPHLPPLEMLKKLGVRRVSAGCAIAQVALGVTGRLASGFLKGEMSELFSGAAEYGALNQLLAR